MFDRIIKFAIEQRWLVMLLVAMLAALGIYNYQKLPLDALPDISLTLPRFHVQQKSINFYVHGGRDERRNRSKEAI
ncbi:efflux RND transporter permease subunit, partial [Noviherbaspirillum suwonense]